MTATIFGPAAMVGFAIVLIGLLALDVGVFRPSPRAIGAREALYRTAFWVALAVAFGVLVWRLAGPAAGLEFFTAYVVEEALSVDNVFFLLVTLVSFRIPEAMWHRVLGWGIGGAIVMRAILIVAGTSLLAYVHAASYLLGGILVVTALRLLMASDHGSEPPERSWLVRFASRILPISWDRQAGSFFVRIGGRLHGTTLLVALVAIEIGDIVFAADSIPAVLAISKDPFLVVSSNVLAILGLRSLFFVVRGAVSRFHYLKAGISVVLLFIGAKMLLSRVWEISTTLSLAVIGAVLVIAAIASLVRDRFVVERSVG